jgi:hypothetical protein
MHKEQQDDNKTKELSIIQDNGTWKVINHEGRTLDATKNRARTKILLNPERSRLARPRLRPASGIWQMIARWE